MLSGEQKYYMLHKHFVYFLTVEDSNIEMASLRSRSVTLGASCNTIQKTSDS